MADIFLSYASDDRARARAFVDLLEEQGWSVWWDREILPGTPFERVIDQAIADASCVVVLWTANSIQSKWVSAEALDGFERDILVPVLLESVRVPFAFRGSQAANLVGWPREQPDLGPLYAAISNVIGRGQSNASVQERAEPRTAKAEEGRSVSVAVLPFENLTGDSEIDYLFEGLSDEVRSGLSRIGDLRVAATSSCYYFKGRSKDVRVIGQLLDVNIIVEGRVRRMPGGYRLQVEAASSRDGFQVYSDSLNFTEDTIAEAEHTLLDRLRDVIKPRASAVPARRDPDPEAYRWYLQGRFHFNNGDSDSRKRAVTAFTRATEVDPELSEAYSGIAWAWGLRSIGSNDPGQPQETLAASRAAAERAFELAPDSAETLGALGVVNIMDWQWDKALDYTRRSLEIDPNDAGARTVYAACFSIRGQLNEAVQIMEGTIRREPLSPIGTNGLARLLRYAGRYHEAEELCLRTLSALPGSVAAMVSLTEASFMKGDVDIIAERIANEEQLMGEDHPTVLFHKCRLATWSTDLEPIERIYKQLVEIRRTSYINSAVMGIVALFLGRFEDGIGWFERGFREKDVWLIDSRYIPFPKGLSDHPRFKAIVEGMNFPTDKITESRFF